jgi:RNA polymerase sigma-70 factor (ECF subfamily)
LALRAADDGPDTAEIDAPEAAALAAERRAILLRALNDLREDDRLVIAYRYFSELTEAEMAELLGVARGTVKSRLSRALGRLRARLTGEDAREATDG